MSVRIEPKDNASANAVNLLDNVDSVGTINDWGAQRTAKFRIHVNPDAVEGDYYFNIYYLQGATNKQRKSSNSNDHQARGPDIDHQR